MNLKKVFYACDNGKDYILSLSEGSKVIHLIDQRGTVTEYRMKDHREAVSQALIWLKHSDPRIPKTFLVSTVPGTDLINLRKVLAEVDLTLPENHHLGTWILFHGHNFSVLDGEIDSNQIPIMDLESLKKIQNRMKRSTYSRRFKPPGGILSEVGA
ncbi:MAG: hypothetical protein WC479_06700 [Candidatus Izemoplasmatales bacterium]